MMFNVKRNMSLVRKLKKFDNVIFAPGINNGGGLVLLECLVHTNRTDILFLVDKRTDLKCQSNIYQIDGIFDRLICEFLFFLVSKKSSKLLFFSNLPPVFKLQCQIFLFIQNEYVIKRLNFKNLRSYGLRNWIKSLIVRLTINEQITIIVQTNLMKEKIQKKFSNLNKNIVVKGFFPRESVQKVRRLTNKSKTTFGYVSTLASHKNHLKLVKAFNAFKKEKNVELILTCTKNEFEESYKIELDEKDLDFSKITFLGYVEHSKTAKVYSNIDYFVFPSLFESFGLPLIEANLRGIPIIASNLPYVLEVCEPTITFEPHSISSIQEALEQIFEAKKPQIQKKKNLDVDKNLISTPLEFLQFIFG